jgi:glycine/D-amino acid oxidase-like deaminating enzyme
VTREIQITLRDTEATVRPLVASRQHPLTSRAVEGTRHTRHGWWLEEAGEVAPTRPLEGDTSADVVIVGGGYLGMWTAWQLLELEPETDLVLLEAAVCGHGPSGRNGGFCETLWGDADTLRERAGDAAALAVCRASEHAVRSIGDWCRENEVDAWYRPAPMLRVATTESQLGSWDDSVRASAELGEPGEIVSLTGEEVRARCASPLFLGGSAQRLNATVQPARLALGLRRRLIERGLRLYERTEVTRLHRDGSVETRTGRVRGGAAILAVNSAAVGFPGYRLSLAVASSHIVLTEPVPDVLEELGWTGGEAIVDSRRLVHYMRTTADDRIAFGWGGGTMGFGARFGFTGNGVGPTFLGGEILARLALDRRDERTSLAIVEPGRKLFPPEPFKYAGGTTIRRALLRKDASEDEGRSPDALTAFVAALPHRLGLHLPR